VEEILAILAQAQQGTPAEVPAVSRDPKDDIFLACAVVNNAQYVVIEDKDLLVLDPCGSIRIVNVLEFLHVIQPGSATETNNPS
jgi:predicted nucleic acid-binding protein